MNHYNYKCFDCEKEYSPAEIEKQFIYLCPKCGKPEEKKPLPGVLLVNYDYEALKKIYNSKYLLKLSTGEFWQYPGLWPLKYKVNSKFPYAFITTEQLNNLSLFSKPIQPISKLLTLFNDTFNPTLSYKDRATILVCLKAKELGIKNIAAASTGNAASSLAGICAKLGLKAHVFVPKRIPKAKLVQIQAFGAKVYLVDGTYDDAFDLCNEVCSLQNWYNRNTAYNPLTIEGKKSAAYDIYISTNGKIPDYIFVPVGDGVIISGLYKGFAELVKLKLIDVLPKLVAVQAEGSNAVVRYINGQDFEAISTNTMADSIDAETPRNLYMAADAVKKSNGLAVDVSDEEIITAQKILAKSYGVLCEPSSAAGYAGYKKLVENGIDDKAAESLLMITGNGLKDISALQSWNKTPESKSIKEWTAYFE